MKHTKLTASLEVIKEYPEVCGHISKSWFAADEYLADYISKRKKITFSHVLKDLKESLEVKK